MSWRDSASGSSTFHGGGGYAGNNANVGAGTGAGNNGGMGGGGSNNSGSRTGGLGGGLSTGNTWHGNTAFGPPGGIANGYATAKLGAGAGTKPTINTYSNFRTVNGDPMFSGAAQNTAIRAPNANMAASALSALQAQAQASAQNVGGLLSDEDEEQPPIDPVVAPPVTAVPTAAWPYANPAVINPYPQWSGAGSWFAGPNYINAGPNEAQWSSSFPNRGAKGDREGTAAKGDLPDNINSYGTTYGRFR